MTNEELEEVLENLKYMISDDCTDCQWGFIDEIELAIQALEKQMSKMVNKKYAMSWCPNCGDIIDRRTTKPIRYCIGCGQALKWEE